MFKKVLWLHVDKQLRNRTEKQSYCGQKRENSVLATKVFRIILFLVCWQFWEKIFQVEPKMKKKKKIEKFLKNHLGLQQNILFYLKYNILFWFWEVYLTNFFNFRKCWKATSHWKNKNVKLSVFFICLFLQHEQFVETNTNS